ncbi:MAG: hypothetical protein KatS3mg109_0628 [Pirellulaceae bacterium]|nr:MAG: hypothetical protein KatS3mg109_0628 [Pirellulaceae bacterium]
MNVAFYYPWIWWAALAVGVPIWLHLVRRREADLVLFSALRFLDDQPVARARPLWPRDLPLLLVRVLAVLLLVAAFAWPYVPQSQPPPEVLQSVVFVLDRTLSHQAQDGWQASLGQLVRAVDSLPAHAQAGIVLVDTVPRVLLDLDESPRKARSRLENLKPGFGRGSYAAALTLAAAMLQKAIGEQHRIVLFVDNQANQWQEDAQTIPFLKNVSIESAARPTPPVLPNVALFSPRAERLRTSQGSHVLCTAQLYRLGDVPQASVEWRVDGKLLKQEQVAFTGDTSLTLLSAEFDLPADRWLTGEVVVTASPDALAADNRLFWALPPQRPGRVEAWVQSPYLLAALSPDVWENQWQITVGQVDQVASDTTVIRPHVIVAELGQLRSQQLRERLAEHISAGGGAVLFVDSVSGPAGLVLHQLGVASFTEVQPPPDHSRIGYRYASHPLVQWLSSGEWGDISTIRVQRYFDMDVPDASPLVFLEAGGAVLWEIVRTGRVFLMAMPVEATSWPRHPSWLGLLDGCMKLARPEESRLVEAHPGEAVRWHLGEPAEERPLMLYGPDGRAGPITAEGLSVMFTAPDEPGVYTLRHEASSDVVGMVVVNPVPSESQLQYVDAEKARAIYQQWVVTGSDDRSPDRSLRLEGEASILSQRWWWGLLVTATVLLCVETVWLVLRSRP